jgi:putative copper export protein/mono/diheme cytochrome c family protein
MTAIEVAAASLRGVQVAALASLFGTLLFVVAVLPPDGAPIRGVLRRLARISTLLGLVAGLGLLAAESAAIADADSLIMTLHTIPTVALETQFGHWLLFRLLLLAGALPLLRRTGSVIPLALAGAALVVQPMLGHAGAIGGNLGVELIVSEALHLLAAGAWLGSLLPLFLAVRRLPHEVAAAACRGFTPIGLAAVLLLAGTAVVQVAEFMGGLPGLFGTGYGHVALVKLGLFIALLALAALNRLVLTDRLATATRSRLHIQVSVAAEIVLGSLVIITAGFLASRTPGTHEQPVWPFPWRFSAWAFADPSFRTEVVIASLAAVAGATIAIVGLAWRRVRWFALGIGAIIVTAAIPHLDLLFVEAYPTSFFTSPTEFAATAIVHGAHLFAANCVACHGAEGRGDGPSAKSLPIPPADLTAAHFRAHSDGDFYWYILRGFTTHDGASAMPGFANVLSSEAIWDLIDYLHAHNGGYTLHRTGSWPQPLPVPQFDAQCANGQIVDLDDLRGRPMRIIAAAGDEQPEPLVPADIDVATILVLRNTVAKPTGTACVASEPQVWTALAIMVGLSPDALSGTQVLVDRNAWLRTVWRPGDPEDLAARLRDIIAHPLVVASPLAHRHRH